MHRVSCVLGPSTGSLPPPRRSAPERDAAANPSHGVRQGRRRNYRAAAAFRLIHVLTPVLAVPTQPPVGNYLPIDQVRPEIAEAYVQEVWVKAQKILAGCKETCDENKVDAQVVLVNGNDVADTISSLVAQHQIQILVVGASRGFFSRTSSKICKGVPSLLNSNY